MDFLMVRRKKQKKKRGYHLCYCAAIIVIHLQHLVLSILFLLPNYVHCLLCK